MCWVSYKNNSSVDYSVNDSDPSNESVFFFRVRFIKDTFFQAQKFGLIETVEEVLVDKTVQSN
jgi:hypothetical protein